MTIDTRARPRAFTLLELLVSLGIIALLVSLVVVSLQGVRLTAQRTESINALRGIMRGYATYSADHRDKLLPGYLDEATLGALRIDPRFPDGTKVIEAEFCNGTVCDASSYVWRLSSYLDHAWESLFTDYRSDELLTNLDCEFNPDASSCGGGRVAGPASADPGAGEFGIGLVPAYGLNSIYLGGDTRHGGGAIVALNPYAPAVIPSQVIAATGLSQVRKPTRIVVFGSARQMNDSLVPNAPLAEDIRFGYVELRPPIVVGPDGTTIADQWMIDPSATDDPSGIVALGDFDAGGGVPVLRWGGSKVPISHLDGSVEGIDFSRLGPDPDTIGVPAARDQFLEMWWPFSLGLKSAG